MKIPSKNVIAFLALPLYFAFNSAGSAAILAIDFNDDLTSTLTQTTFQPFVQGGSPIMRSYSSTIGTLDVTVSGHETGTVGGFHSRADPVNSGVFTYSDLYRDFAFRNSAGAITLSIAGVQPNTPYELTFWSSDRFTSTYVNTATNTITPISTTTGSTGTISFDRTVSATSNFQHSYTGTYQTTSNTLTFTIVDTLNTGGQRMTRLNGFTLVPEPSSALLGALGMLALLRRRR